MQVLFITSKNIGDAILSTSILEYIHDTHPTAQVTIVSGDRPAGLFSAPFIHRVIPIKKKPYKGHWLDIWKATGLKLWDWLIDLRGAPLSYIIPAKRKFLWRPLNEEAPKMAQLAAFMGQARLPMPKLYPTAAHYTQATQFLSLFPAPPIVLGATANWHAKCWPNEKFAQLTKALLKERFPKARFVALGGPQDNKSLEELSGMVPKGLVTPLAGKMDLLTTAAFIEQTPLFVGNDSGLMHLAAATGTPTLGLFGPSRETIYHPVGPKCNWVRTDKTYGELVQNPDYDWKRPKNMMGSLSVEKVLQGISTLLDQP